MHEQGVSMGIQVRHRASWYRFHSSAARCRIVASQDGSTRLHRHLCWAGQCPVLEACFASAFPRFSPACASRNREGTASSTQMQTTSLITVNERRAVGPASRNVLTVSTYSPGLSYLCLTHLLLPPNPHLDNKTVPRQQKKNPASNQQGPK